MGWRRQPHRRIQRSLPGLGHRAGGFLMHGGLVFGLELGLCLSGLDSQNPSTIPRSNSQASRWAPFTVKCALMLSTVLRAIWASDLQTAASVVWDLLPFDFFGGATLAFSGDKRGRRRDARSARSNARRQRFLQVQEGSARALSIEVLPCESSLFGSRKEPTLLGHYHWTGQWLLCRIFSTDDDGSYTVVWQDGFLQVGTRAKELRALSPSLERRVRRQYSHAMAELRNESLKGATSCAEKTVAARPPQEPATLNGLNVWEAAKLGDLETALAIIDSGAASPNDVELLDAGETDYRAEGRTPLYWACFGGHVELVRELLLRGGEDRDGAAYCAVTTRQAANDHRDILFDPDTGVYSDYVDYDPDKAEPPEATNDDEALLIRALLVTAKSAKCTSAQSLRQRLPKKLYRELRRMCIICLQNGADAIALPCGHVACCWSCVKKIRKRGEGCPMCRAPILAVERSTVA